MESSMNGIVWSTTATSVMAPLAHRPQVRRVPPRHGRAAAAWRDRNDASRCFDLRFANGENARKSFGEGKQVSMRPPGFCVRGRRGLPFRAYKKLLNSLTGVVSRAFHIAGGDA